jgi:hypothetical protein
MGFLIRSRGADAFRDLNTRGDDILGGCYAAYAIALVTDADEDLLASLVRHGGQIDNVTGHAVAFVVLVDKVTVSGEPGNLATTSAVHKEATEQVFRVPARGLLGHRALTREIKESDAWITGPASFVIDPSQSTAFARRTWIELSRLPAIAVWDRGSEELTVISDADWQTMLEILFAGVSDLYARQRGNRFLELAREVSEARSRMMELELLETEARRKNEQGWLPSAPITVEEIFRSASSLEQFDAHLAEALASTTSGPTDLQTEEARRYWQLQTLRRRQRAMYEALREARRGGRTVSDSDRRALRDLWAEIAQALGGEPRSFPDPADLGVAIERCREYELDLRAARRAVSTALDDRLKTFSRQAFLSARLGDELQASRTNWSELDQRLSEIGDELRMTPAPALSPFVEAAIKRHRKDVKIFRLKLGAARAGTFLTNLLGAISALPT